MLYTAENANSSAYDPRHYHLRIPILSGQVDDRDEEPEQQDDTAAAAADDNEQAGNETSLASASSGASSYVAYKKTNTLPTAPRRPSYGATSPTSWVTTNANGAVLFNCGWPNCHAAPQSRKRMNEHFFSHRVLLWRAANAALNAAYVVNTQNGGRR
ncbi:Uu.00g033930.m01.CDS01 [Anthostomella pinea]|uniref:Uu.00g033930.m01.CDS01 n=1 Tax=Anthostomella pinea TaxID=933095 RepID=A0AAI8V8Z2_9PEZI|nr:Uu.00g033930.m01.CDS01 [Anthostomella pinea]